MPSLKDADIPISAHAEDNLRALATDAGTFTKERIETVAREALGLISALVGYAQGKDEERLRAQAKAQQDRLARLEDAALLAHIRKVLGSFPFTDD